MLILGVLLLVFAAALFYFFAEPAIRFLAFVLGAVGLILIVIFVLDVARVHGG